MAALVWRAEQDATCKGCGHPLSEALDPENQSAYVGDWYVCHACAARDRQMDALENPPRGAYFLARRQ